MKLELLIFGTTAFFIYNAYHDNKYTKMLLSYKKYYKMIFIGLVALCIYLMIKRNPLQSKNLLLYTNNMIKYLPIDKSSIDMISPIFDLSTKNQNRTSFMEGMNGINPNQEMQHRNLLSYPKATKRSVSETKKKYVAANQDWKCGQCNNQLTHTFEIDHKIRLEHGGSNDATNLVALCRECHGQKTAMENM
jgi:hypothetical protein